MSKDITARKHGGNTESEAAYESVKDTVTVTHIVILNLLKDEPRSAKEVAEQLGKDLHTITPRFSELKKKNLIEPTGLCLNRSRVCRITESGKQHLPT